MRGSWMVFQRVLYLHLDLFGTSMTAVVAILLRSPSCTTTAEGWWEPDGVPFNVEEPLGYHRTCCQAVKY
jgi:hypothetical protein